MLELDRVNVTLGAQRILDDVSLTVAPGELVGLIGPNGAGKSTLLAVISGDIVPDDGTVTLDDRPLAAWSVRALARRRAVLMQEQRLAFGFTSREVVRMGRAPWAGTDEEESDEDIIDASSAAADVAHLGHRVHPTLSGGEKARTGFARILAQRTDLVLLDEPTAALDLRHQEQVLATAVELARSGRAVVAVLHDLSLAAAHADRLVLLDGGRVAAHGTPRDVITAEIVGRVYGLDVDVLDHDGSLVVVPHRHRTTLPAQGEEASCPGV